MESKRLEAMNHYRAEHKKACKCLAVTLVVLGGVVCALGSYELGLPLEAAGLYLVELI